MTVLTRSKRRIAARKEARIAVAPEGVAPLIERTHDGVPSSRDLLLQALLHLPRIATSDGTVCPAAAANEIDRLRNVRSQELSAVRSLARRPPGLDAVDQLEIRTVDNAEAAPILSTYHYLTSFRDDSLAIGAVFEKRVVALCTLSPFDLGHVEKHLPVSPDEVAVVSRVFTFDWAPRNTISFLLARTERAAREAGTRMLLTYLNPNMPFSGSSYRAANWVSFAREAGTRYAYLNDHYITERKLREVAPNELAAVQYSQMPLKPLILLCRLIDKRLRRARSSGWDHLLARAEPS